MSPEVRYHMLRPRQIAERRDAYPVAYIPIGTLEWHGLHNPVGADTLQAEGLAILCAQRGGGLVFPPLWYGESRVESLMDANAPDREEIAKAMGLDPGNFLPDRMPFPAMEQSLNYEKLLLHILAEVMSLGFRLGVIVAEVGDRRITRGEWDLAYENLLNVYRRVYQDRLSEEMVKQLRLREAALDNLINTEIQLQEARRWGLEVSDDELRERVRSMPYFQRDGRFAKDLYLRLLQLNRMTPADFERQQRDEMLVGAFQNFIRGTVKVSEQELWNSYVLENEQIRLEAYVVSPSAFEGEAEVDEGALKAYFQKNLNAFLTPEKAKAAYVLVDPQSYRNQVEVYTGDIEEYYYANIEDFSYPEEIRLRHLMLRLPPGADEPARLEKRNTLEGVLERVRKGEDFAALAKTYSEDAGSRDQGGDLGYVKRGQLLPEVEGAAFALKPGEVSEIVSSTHGFHLIKVEDYRASRVEPLEEVKEQIRETLTEEKAWRLARRKAEATSWDLKEKGAFPEVGSLAADSVVKETGYFSRGDAVGDLGQEEAFKQAVFSLEPGQRSEVIRGKRGYYLLHVIERRPPEAPPFEDVRDRVEKQFRMEKARELASKRAEEVLKMARSDTSLDALLEQKEVQALDTGFFSRLQIHIPRIGPSEELIESAFTLTLENPWARRVFELYGKFYVIRLKERKEPSRKVFLAEKEELRTRQEREKQEEVYRDWLSELRKRQEVKVSAIGT